MARSFPMYPDLDGYRRTGRGAVPRPGPWAVHANPRAASSMYDNTRGTGSGAVARYSPWAFYPTPRKKPPADQSSALAGAEASGGTVADVPVPMVPAVASQYSMTPQQVEGRIRNATRAYQAADAAVSAPLPRQEIPEGTASITLPSGETITRSFTRVPGPVQGVMATSTGPAGAPGVSAPTFRPDRTQQDIDQVMANRRTYAFGQRLRGDSLMYPLSGQYSFSAAQEAQRLQPQAILEQIAGQQAIRTGQEIANRFAPLMFEEQLAGQRADRQGTEIGNQLQQTYGGPMIQAQIDRLRSDTDYARDMVTNYSKLQQQSTTLAQRAAALEAQLKVLADENRLLRSQLIRAQPKSAPAARQSVSIDKLLPLLQGQDDKGRPIPLTPEQITQALAQWNRALQGGDQAPTAQQPAQPSTQPSPPMEYNPATGEIKVWDGKQWVPVG